MFLILMLLRNDCLIVKILTVIYVFISIFTRLWRHQSFIFTVNFIFFIINCIPIEWWRESSTLAFGTPFITYGWHQIANAGSEMCIDSAASPEDMKKPVNLWPCHGEYGNQVCRRPPNYSNLPLSLNPVVGCGAHHHVGKFGCVVAYEASQCNT